MKIKITLIAFFASVLFLTSCMKNEVSPGIEEVRSAYAAFLNAKAQAELIKANADAELTRAQAAVQLANAELTQAQAADQEALTAQKLEALAQAIEMNKVALAAAQLAQQKLDDAYAALLIANKNTLVGNYFTNYTNALTAVNVLQDAIYDKQKAILDLNLDLVNGTDKALTAANAAYAAKMAEIAALEAELAVAQGILGDPAAITAKLAELVNDSVQLEVLIATLAIDKKNEEPNFADEATAEGTAAGKYATALGKKLDADTALMNAEADFLKDTVGTFPVPEFWQKALDSVANTGTRLTNGATDTLNSAAALKAATDLIALGVSDIDAMITGATDSSALYVDSVAQATADTLAKLATKVAADAAVVAAKADTAAWNALVKTYQDSNMTIKGRWIAALPAGPLPDLDSAKFAAWSLDSLLKTAELTIAEATTVPNAILAASNAATAFTNSLTAYDNDTTAYNPVIRALAVNAAAYAGQKTARLAAIATATAQLPDLTSDYLYHQTFMADLLQAVVDAKAYKEAVRPDYNTWKAEFYAAYVADLEADLAAKVADLAAKKTVWDDAIAALKTAKAAWTLLDDAQTKAAADLVIVKAFQGLYATVDGINTNFVAAFEAAITTAKGMLPGLQATIDLAEAAYQTGLVNNDKFNEDLADLAAKLVAAQDQVTFWKALLDEALAN